MPELRWNQEIWGESVRRHLTKGTRWLDAGCGWRLLGEDLESLENDLISSSELTVGVDVNVPHLEKHLNIKRCVCATLDELPFPDEAFDLVTCNMVVEHLSHPVAIFQEFSRVLSPGGTLMVHTPNTRNYIVFASMMAKKFLPRSVILRLIPDSRSEEDIFPTFYRANSPAALRAVGESASLIPESTRFLTQPLPFTRFFAPAALFELLMMRATMSPPFDRFAATIVMVYRKAGVPSPDFAMVA